MNKAESWRVIINLNMGNCCSGEPTQNSKEEVNMQRDFKNGGANSNQRVAN